eukprot:TRINITY_DN24763_c0_g1_i1.p1 TRINITY_DN24763_c0_g1~~TRINITY_DN24763_c0_g1_i1.p1  ORF type:complete len:226 (-),score=54.96 TRINITY_DN24763_c0_g1_i1:1-678(-)
MVFVISLIAVFLHSSTPSGIKQSIGKTYVLLTPSLLLLSISYEVLFYACLGLHLFIWLNIELSPRSTSSSLSSSSSRSTLDVRRATIYIIECYGACFGTGDIASISSFELSSTYRLVTVFSPFTMSALLVWKLIAPVVVVAVVYSGLTRSLRSRFSSGFLLVLALADVMTVNFFFLVKDEGSWQDIGISISHFAIANFIIILQLVFFSLSSLFLRNTHVPKPHVP